jgi:carbon storage regulator
MLVLTRKLGEKVVINGNVTLTVVETKGNRVTLAFDAPTHIRILRGELLEQGEPAQAGSKQLDPVRGKKPVEWEQRAPVGASH